MKVRHADLDAVRESIAKLGARFTATENQRDTYFRVPHGRLKLRAINRGPANLIWYDRPNQAEVRASAYHLVPVADPEAFRAALAAALGIRGEVWKDREIHLWHNVRIHLDQVAGLGSFLEFEAVLGSEGDEALSSARLDHLCAVLELSPERIGVSYADLLGL